MKGGIEKPGSNDFHDADAKAQLEVGSGQVSSSLYPHATDGDPATARRK